MGKVGPPIWTKRQTATASSSLRDRHTSTIIKFGACSLSLDIGLRRLFPRIFVVADIPCAFLWADFLAAFDLLVNCRQSRLHEQTTNLTVRGISSSDASRQLSVLDPEPDNPFRQLLTNRLAPARLAAAKSEFEHMLQMGIIRQSESPWASAFHMVPNAATGDWHPCGD
nr:unnamed protein product [Spirometra erinaceieuropaei]